MRATALQGASGEGQGAVSAAVDITERKQYEERLKLLLNELNHRVKNTLATVQSLAMQTLRNGGSTEHARLQFEGRLIALSKAHDILTQESWEGAPLRKIVEQAILPFAGERLDRFKIRGPDVRMPPKSALALAMALHELCTNAVKYGSLSSETGYVHVDWTATAEGSKQLQLQWNEVGGPRVGPPSRRGFGSRLIETGLKRDLDGEVTLDFAPAGVVCTVRAPINLRANDQTQPE